MPARKMRNAVQEWLVDYFNNWGFNLCNWNGRVRLCRVMVMMGGVRRMMMMVMMMRCWSTHKVLGRICTRFQPVERCRTGVTLVGMIDAGRVIFWLVMVMMVAVTSSVSYYTVGTAQMLTDDPKDDGGDDGGQDVHVSASCYPDGRAGSEFVARRRHLSQ